MIAINNKHDEFQEHNVKLSKQIAEESRGCDFINIKFKNIQTQAHTFLFRDKGTG